MPTPAPRIWPTAPTPQERKAREESSFLLSPDGAGHVVDFHCLRHTAGSLLAAAQVHPKVAQSIMRHSSIELTMSRYTHVYAGQETAAVAALPDLGQSPVRESARATGTDNVKATQDAIRMATNDDRTQGRPVEPAARDAGPIRGDSRSLPCADLALERRISHETLECNGVKTENAHSEQTAENKAQALDCHGQTSLREPGLEPGTYALKVRCSAC